MTSSLQPFIAVEWSRLDLTLPVLFYKDERLDEIHQHRSFVGRVDLLDREMKDGDLSMIISNVSSSDTGTYECRVKENEGKRRRRAVIDSEPINIVNLTVKHSGEFDQFGRYLVLDYGRYLDDPNGHIGQYVW